MNKMREEELIAEFIGGRYLDKDVMSIIEPLLENIPDTLHRGMRLPIDTLKEGLVLEEWYGSSHWSIDERVARDFSIEPCPADVYVDEVADKKNISIDEAVELFQPVMLKLNGVDSGLRTYKLAEKYKETEIFIKEKEVSTFGIDTVVTKVEKCKDKDGVYHLLHVEVLK